MFAAYIVPYLIYLIPLAVLVLFAVSLILYLTAKHRNKRNPGTYTDRQMKARFIFTVVTGIIAAVMAASVIGIMVLLFTAVAFM